MANREKWSKIELGDVTPHNIKQLKRLNTVVFPVSYNEKFYKDVLEVGELAKLAYYNDIVVGAVCCRIDNSENARRLYIMTLGCLSPYRRLGVGTTMVEHVLNYVERDGNYDNIYLHVQVNNTGAIDFYKKFGFEIHETKKRYYKRIEPADAHVLQKNLRPALTNEYGVKETGYRDGDKYVEIPEKIPELIVPDLDGFNLKPYVSYRAADVYQTEFTAKDLFDAVYAKKIIDDFKAGKLDASGDSLEPSEDELLTAEEAKIRARKTGADICSERSKREEEEKYMFHLNM